MKSTDLLQLVDNLKQAGKIHNLQQVWGVSGCVYLSSGTPEREKGQGAEFVEGHRQNFNYVKIHTLEFRGSVAFLLRQILTNHILSIASAMTLNINTSQISSIDRVTAGFIITN